MPHKLQLTASNLGKRLLKDETKFMFNIGHMLMMSVTIAVTLASETPTRATIMDVIFNNMLFYILTGAMMYGVEQILVYYTSSESFSDDQWNRWKNHIVFVKYMLSLASLASGTTGMLSFGVVITKLMDNKPNRALFLTLQIIIAAAISGTAVLLGIVKVERPGPNASAELPM